MRKSYYSDMKKPAAIVVYIIMIVLLISAATACTRGSDDDSDMHNMGQHSENHYPPNSGNETEIIAYADIPYLIGYTRDELAEYFEGLGLTPTFLRLISDEPPDTVLSIEQIWTPGEPHANIVVHISGGLPEYVPEPELNIPPQLSGGLPEYVPEPELDIPPQQFDKMEFGGINWLVLDERDDRVLLVSEYIVFEQPYHHSFTAMTWEHSALRGYLNYEFLTRFSLEEQARIAETGIENNDVLWTVAGGSWYVPGGNDTYDRIFLLSLEEAERYFESYSARMAKNDDGSAAWWWLRSPGLSSFTAAYVLPDGIIKCASSHRHRIGVRPALWLYVE